VPLPPARRRYTTGIERLSNLPQRRRARLLRLPDDRQDVGRVLISFGLDRFHSAFACHMELRARGGWRRLRAPNDHQRRSDIVLVSILLKTDRFDDV
jgi:hypothetical protein